MFNSLDAAQLCAEGADDKKAFDILILDLREFTYITDYFVISRGAIPLRWVLLPIASAIPLQGQASVIHMWKGRQRPLGCSWTTAMWSCMSSKNRPGSITALKNSGVRRRGYLLLFGRGEVAVGAAS